jgi:2'-5' RNA ligase
MGHDGDPMRLFVGVEVPADASRALDVVTTQWRGRLPLVRWSPAEDRHATLAFLGDVAPAIARGAKARLVPVARALTGFETTLDRVGGFPSSARARVVWMGLNDPDGAWAGLASEIRAALADLVPTQPKSFVPHVTLARSARSIALPRPLVKVAEPRATFTVDGFTLFRSHPDRGGPRYERLERFELGPVP